MLHAARCVCAGVQTPNFVRFFASDCRYSQGMYKAWLRTAAAFRGQVTSCVACRAVHGVWGARGTTRCKLHEL